MSNNYNTWGGKNNSWGNRNKKNKSTQPQYRENKAFKIFAICFLGAILVGGGIGTISDFLDKADQVTEVVETVDKITSTEQNKNSSKADNIGIENNSGTDLELEDIKDLLEKIDEASSENNLQAEVENIVVLQYNQINTLESFTENIVDKLPNYNNTVSYAIIMNEISTEEDVYTNLDIIKQFMDNTKQDIKCKNTILGGLSNIPNINDFTATITYIK